MSRRVRFALRLSVVILLVVSLAFFPMDKTLALTMDGYHLLKNLRRGYEMDARLRAIHHRNAALRSAPLVQGGVDLDFLRGNTPNLPDPPSSVNVAPPTGYDDPMPTDTAKFNDYLTNLSKADHDTGLAGSKPLQNADPSIGTAVAGGMSYNFDSRNLSFTAPVVSLGGRAGMNLSLGLTYNSRVWGKSALGGYYGQMFFNPDKGNPAPGWRIGFGAIQGINSGGNVGPYTNGVTGKASFLYIAPDGTRHDLAYNSTSTLYESYDASYLDFNATTKVLRTTSGTRVTFGATATANGDYQWLATEIKD
jgi:hypothetical protein